MTMRQNGDEMVVSGLATDLHDRPLQFRHVQIFSREIERKKICVRNSVANPSLFVFETKILSQIFASDDRYYDRFVPLQFDYSQQIATYSAVAIL